jgi:Ca-activated chloride channel family protein
LGKEEDLAEVYTTLDRVTPEKVKLEIYRPQREFFWIPLAAALLIFTLYHSLALLIAWARSPRREAAPARETFGEASRGN